MVLEYFFYFYINFNISYFCVSLPFINYLVILGNCDGIAVFYHIYIFVKFYLLYFILLLSSFSPLKSKYLIVLSQCMYTPVSRAAVPDVMVFK